MEKDVLRISRITFGYDDYVKPLKLAADTHARVKELAERTNRPLSEVANLLVNFALARVEIAEEN